MPYINKEQRQEVDATIDELVSKIRHVETTAVGSVDGITNYVISRIIAESFRPDTGWRYSVLNRAYGTFLSAAAEFLRRLVVPYERRKAADLDLECYKEFDNG